ncbi:acetyltransferase [Kosmotoga arenicorallina S304]|uniref:Acetyltransferase n=1 Tax=Kosmotoga arenicorallina S304 TaxID=1453497 RepID=A0A176K3I6_9BACT|nr:GNAT family N-acetyltransferase [Kosmotoga arenicorallina]OAA31586.1 acetyltransferase [Kosmotoga arenicorallina S304]
MRNISLKNGLTAIIREANPEDAPRLLRYIEQVSGESEFLTFGPGEFEITVEKEKEFIKSIKDIENALMILVELDGKIVGMLNFNGGTRPRTRHRGEFGISVLKDYWGHGIATAMLEYLIEWAKEHEILKIDLMVREDNERAIKLYEKLGFKREGHISRYFKLRKKFYGVIYMGLEL